MDKLLLFIKYLICYTAFSDFEFVKKDTLIGYDNDLPIKADNDGFILFARNRKKDDKDKDAFMFLIEIG